MCIVYVCICATWDSTIYHVIDYRVTPRYTGNTAKVGVKNQSINLNEACCIRNVHFFLNILITRVLYILSNYAMKLMNRQLWGKLLKLWKKRAEICYELFIWTPVYTRFSFSHLYSFHNNTTGVMWGRMCYTFRSN